MKMENFTGTKNILGLAMTLGEYNKYRGWKLPATEDPDKEGYLVEYEPVKGEEPNHKAHKGYISWSPKQAFENSYRESGTHLQRMNNELADLVEKAGKINTFQKTKAHAALDKTARRDLRIQLKAMREYADALAIRLGR